MIRLESTTITKKLQSKYCIKTNYRLLCIEFATHEKNSNWKELIRYFKFQVFKYIYNMHHIIRNSCLFSYLIWCSKRNLLFRNTCLLLIMQKTFSKNYKSFWSINHSCKAIGLIFSRFDCTMLIFSYFELWSRCVLFLFRFFFSIIL